MVREIAGEKLLLGPRAKGLAFTTKLDGVHTLSPGERIEVDGITVRGIEAVHGKVRIKIGPIEKVVQPGPEERIGRGAIGFELGFDGLKVVNLGDTLLLEEKWKDIQKPDLLMIPIGGRTIYNTMDEAAALKAVALMKPRHVIPCHYNCKAFFTQRYNPADEQLFRKGVEDLGFQCSLLKPRQSVRLFEESS